MVLCRAARPLHPLCLLILGTYTLSPASFLAGFTNRLEPATVLQPRLLRWFASGGPSFSQAREADGRSFSQARVTCHETDIRISPRTDIRFTRLMYRDMNEDDNLEFERRGVRYEAGTVRYEFERRRGFGITP